ncbi:MAG: ABC transporter substrate-binding protein, partial [Bacteroidales bacterium]
GLTYKNVNKLIQYTALMIIVLYSCIGKPIPEENIRNLKSDRIKYATHFEIKTLNDYTRLSVIDPWQKTSGIRFDYYLVKGKAKLPEQIDSSSVIHVPVKKVVLMSTTYIPMILFLGRDKSIMGISGTYLVYNQEIRKRISEGLIAEVGYEENLNKELIIKLSPDLLITYGVGSETAGNYRKLQESGIKVMFNADYLEETPLGRAEWIKVFGAIYCMEKEADSLFSLIVNNYDEIKSYVMKNASSKPSVMLGLPWKNSWFVSPGNSYTGKLIEDAGGIYVWKDLKAAYSVPFGVENVFVNASKADFWLNTGDAPDLESIISIDGRLKYFNPVKKGNIFNNNKRISERGGNDYWESGVLSPDIILKDIASILHPELFPDYVPYYYKKIE